VAAHLVESDVNRNLHILGISAGANLALVAGMEIYRRYPGRVSSIFAASPMLDPAADSISYFQNSTSSSFCPPHFLRWSWQVYLGMPSPVEDNDNKNDVSSQTPSSLENLLARGSNRQAWSECKWRTMGKLRRLIEPGVELPANLDDPAALEIILTTNAADPLGHEGIILSTQLKEAGAKVQYVPFKGSHWLGTVFDTQGYQALARDWRDLVFVAKKAEKEDAKK
jgi:acetyl esterase/lipase